MGSALTGNWRIPGTANMADTPVMENLWAISYSLGDTRGIKLQTQMSVAEPGCLISSAFVLKFAVPVRLPVIYVCVLFVFHFRNPSIQQRGSLPLHSHFTYAMKFTLQASSTTSLTETVLCTTTAMTQCLR